MKKKQLPKMERKIKLFFALSLIMAFCIQLKAQTTVRTVPHNFRGQNTWMPSRLGNNQTLSGKMDFCYLDLQEAGVETYRFGGKGVEDWINGNHITSDYLATIDSISRNNPKARIILQLPYNKGNLIAAGYTDNLSGAAQQAKEIVTQVKLYVDNLNQKPHYNIKIMWMISNEPDHAASNMKYTHIDSVPKIKEYVEAFSIKIREADANAQIIAPGLTYFRENFINALTDQGNTATNILPYITHFSVHFYPFNHMAKYDAWCLLPQGKM
ncbi:MAG: cellulase family glycosylhydrolase [Bacteroidetes bacterium]|nr:cellulase family glycosylhydrolase [Bacteroidota bacterium]